MDGIRSAFWGMLACLYIGGCGAPHLESEVKDGVNVDDYSVRMHIHNLVEASASSEFETLASLAAPFRYVSATFWVETEVNNGGFDQYFYNTGGAYVPDAVSGFRAMKADGYAALLEEANKVFCEHYPKPKVEDKNSKVPWYQRHHRRIPAFEALDKRFYALEKTKRPASFREEYIAANAEVFKKVQPTKR